MPFADPSPTQADLRFQLFGFPIRIHPFFWLMCILVGPKEPKIALLWTIAVFVSIIVHELGHAVLQRVWGGRPHIVLYGFGGLASASDVRLTPWRQVAISLAGPGAGFLLSGIAWLVAPYLGGLPAVIGTVLAFVVFIGIFWGIFNLLPIYPLDGGQVARELFTMAMPADRGIVASLWVSIVTCAVAAAWLWSRTGSVWNLVLMAALAINNYQTLEAYRRMRYGGY